MATGRSLKGGIPRVQTKDCRVRDRPEPPSHLDAISPCALEGACQDPGSKARIALYELSDVLSASAEVGVPSVWG